MRDFFRHNDEYQHRMHNKNLLYVHLIFVVKYRKKLLIGSLSEDVKQYIFDICNRHHWYIVRMETDKDHIYILLQYNPSDSLTVIASTLKSYSTYHLWKHRADILRREFWKERTFWSDGYFAASVGNASKATIEHYIENQG